MRICVVSVFGQCLLPDPLRPGLEFGIPGLAVVVAVFCVLSAMKSHGRVFGIVMGVLGIVPRRGLLVLRMINSRLPSVRKQNGISVGFPGAEVNSMA